MDKPKPDQIVVAAVALRHQAELLKKEARNKNTREILKKSLFEDAAYMCDVATYLESLK